MQANTDTTCKIHGVVKYRWGTLRGAKVAAGEKSATSDGAGAYEIGALAPGVYDVAVKPPFPGYEVSPQKVELAAGETKVVDIYLDYEKAVVEGHVYDQAGKPITGATLSGVLCGENIGTMTTNEQGYFKFERVTPGDRFIRVNAPGYMGDTRDFKVSQDKSVALEFRLTSATCRIHGTVTDENDQPLEADVRLFKSGVIVQDTKSKGNGYYEFHLVPGEYQLLATAPDHGFASWDGSISGDIETNLHVGPYRERLGLGGWGIAGKYVTG